MADLYREFEASGWQWTWRKFKMWTKKPCLVLFLVFLDLVCFSFY